MDELFVGESEVRLLKLVNGEVDTTTATGKSNDEMAKVDSESTNKHPDTDSSEHHHDPDRKFDDEGTSIARKNAKTEPES